MARSHRSSIIANAPIGRTGITLVELLVVLAIIGLIIGLAIPAIQAARESSRRTQCQNNLHQLSLAVLMHEEQIGHFPTNGWNERWAGDGNRGFGLDQPGGWCFNVLSFLESESLRNQSEPQGSQFGIRDRIAASLAKPVSVFYCPSRRGAAAYPYSGPALLNSAAMSTAAKTDYGICGGSDPIAAIAGPPSDDPQVVAAYAWPPESTAKGISASRSRFRSGDVPDGLSLTIFVGEKNIAISYYHNGQDPGDRQGAFVGDSDDNRRWTLSAPKKDDTSNSSPQEFGSPHAACHLAIGDGSVRGISYQVDPTVFRAMGNRADKGPTSLPQ